MVSAIVRYSSAIFRTSSGLVHELLRSQAKMGYELPWLRDTGLGALPLLVNWVDSQSFPPCEVGARHNSNSGTETPEIGP